jgi:hypothetical protein
VRVLIGCERSRRVAKAFRARGHDAYSCDLEPAEDGNTEHHIQDNVLWHLNDGWDLMIVFPDCTYLSGSGLHWNKRRTGRTEKTEKSLAFVEALLNAAIPKIALENPVGCISTRIRKPDQIIQPWYFGEDASKKTCLWLKNLPLLQPTDLIYKVRYANQTPSGQNKLGPSPTRAMERARTYQGIADAMAQQWG